MQLTPRLHKAIYQAAVLHSGQTRKADATPYIIHPYAVAWILANYTDNEDIIIAGLLHDVLEDVKCYRVEDMQRDFGEQVTRIVKEVSEDKDPNVEQDDKATWQMRKEKYLANLANDSYEALMVCCADKIHNLTSMLEVYKIQGEKMWQKFNAPIDKQLWFYQEILKILQTKLDNPIVQELSTIYHTTLETFRLSLDS